MDEKTKQAFVDAVREKRQSMYRAAYGYVDIDDEKAAGIPLGDKVWCGLWEDGHALLNENGQKLR